VVAVELVAALEIRHFVEVCCRKGPDQVQVAGLDASGVLASTEGELAATVQVKGCPEVRGHLVAASAEDNFVELDPSAALEEVYQPMAMALCSTPGPGLAAGVDQSRRILVRVAVHQVLA
jgi:hypothetical protein